MPRRIPAVQRGIQRTTGGAKYADTLLERRGVDTHVRLEYVLEARERGACKLASEPTMNNGAPEMGS